MNDSSGVNLHYSEHAISDILLVEQSLKGARFVEGQVWNTEATRYTGPGEVILRHRFASSETVMVEFDKGAFAVLTVGHGNATVRVASSTEEAVPAILALLHEAIPQIDVLGNMRPVSFWSDSQHGPRCTTRMLAVPGWKDVDVNYPERVANKLRDLMIFRPSNGGQLILWRGEPGTGKTYALRAVINEWSKWARFHYITDPDCFFGHNASYMLQVILGEEDYPDESGEELWKVLVLEDSGEMLSKDARERSGQGLSRLLNLVDGLIGQGLRVLVLVTTNEELGVLHPAISRPGRCVANIEFPKMGRDEARQWLESHDAVCDAPASATIAELYALLQGRSANERELVGFAR